MISIKRLGPMKVFEPIKGMTVADFDRMMEELEAVANRPIPTSDGPSPSSDKSLLKEVYPSLPQEEQRYEPQYVRPREIPF